MTVLLSSLLLLLLFGRELLLRCSTSIVDTRRGRFLLVRDCERLAIIVLIGLGFVGKEED